jgi:hypothetical protein
LEVEVVNRGSSGKIAIPLGKGKAALRTLLPTIGKATSFTIDLSCNGGSEKKGQVKILGTLSDFEGQIRFYDYGAFKFD